MISENQDRSKNFAKHKILFFFPTIGPKGEMTKEKWKKEERKETKT